MKKALFKTLVKINNIILPSLHKKDPNTLSNLQKVILGYRYWALTNSLD